MEALGTGEGNAETSGLTFFNGKAGTTQEEWRPLSPQTPSFPAHRFLKLHPEDNAHEMADVPIPGERDSVTDSFL